MVGMVLLVAVFLTLIGLLGVVMVAATRHLLDHPDEPVHDHGDGGWSSTADTKDAGVAGRSTSPVPAPRGAPVRAFDVPLDDMPAEVLAEVAQRLRRTGP